MAHGSARRTVARRADGERYRERGGSTFRESRECPALPAGREGSVSQWRWGARPAKQVPRTGAEPVVGAWCLKIRNVVSNPLIYHTKCFS